MFFKFRYLVDKSGESKIGRYFHFSRPNIEIDNILFFNLNLNLRVKSTFDYFYEFLKKMGVKTSYYLSKKLNFWSGSLKNYMKNRSQNFKII